jgi:hypothetical protein
MDQFISDYQPEVQTSLQKIRELIQKSALGVEEAMSYGMPTFKLNWKNLVHFSAFKEHIGFYRMPLAERSRTGDIRCIPELKEKRCWLENDIIPSILNWNPTARQLKN